LTFIGAHRNQHPELVHIGIGGRRARSTVDRGTHRQIGSASRAFVGCGRLPSRWRGLLALRGTTRPVSRGLSATGCSIARPDGIFVVIGRVDVPRGLPQDVGIIRNRRIESAYGGEALTVRAMASPVSGIGRQE
jgi:hypothetical protein